MSIFLLQHIRTYWTFFLHWPTNFSFSSARISSRSFSTLRFSRKMIRTPNFSSLRISRCMLEIRSHVVFIQIDNPKNTYRCSCSSYDITYAIIINILCSNRWSLRHKNVPNPLEILTFVCCVTYCASFNYPNYINKLSVRQYKIILFFLYFFNWIVTSLNLRFIRFHASFALFLFLYSAARRSIE